METMTIIAIILCMLIFIVLTAKKWLRFKRNTPLETKVILIPISKKYDQYCKQLAEKNSLWIVDDSKTPVNVKVKKAKANGAYEYYIVVGEREINSDELTFNTI